MTPRSPADEPDGTDALAIAHAKAQWVTGDWNALLQLDASVIESHRQRDRLALLVACAHQQQGRHEQAADYARRALAWGCDPRLAARLLVSGLHNTLGRIGALKGDNAMAQAHFEKALGVTGDRDSKAAAHGRAVREMARLGLLPQAAWLVRDELDALVREPDRPAMQASRVDMLRSEVELLQHELSLAQQRNLALSTQVPAPSSAGDSDGAALKALSPSQLGQDLWVLERTGYLRGGFFVEFGATDGVRLSNTYLLETRFDWHGICAEPNPKMYAKLRANRRCIVSDACIGPRSGEQVDFVLAEEYGGRVQDMGSDMHAGKRQAYWANDEYRARFETVSLHDLLERLGAPQCIDYLSIDTEGSEFDILAAFPFEQWNVRLITVEHNFTPVREQIRRLLESHGYERTERSHDDFYERQA